MSDGLIDRRRFLALAGLGVTGSLLAACGNQPNTEWNGGASPGASSPGGSPSPTGTPAPTGKPVHVRLFQGDGSTWGVGMPIIAYLSAKITDAKPFAAATQVTVNGAPAQGAWYFQNSAIYKDYPIEAHYRLAEYWPAHATIRMDLPVQGISGGPDWVYDNSLTLDMATGKANISKIDGKTLRMITTSDGEEVFNFPVSLGKASTPTFNGIKLVMGRTSWSGWCRPHPATATTSRFRGRCASPTRASSSTPRAGTAATSGSAVHRMAAPT